MTLQKRPCADCANCTLVNRPYVASKLTASSIAVITEAPTPDDMQSKNLISGTPGRLLDYVISKTGEDPQEVNRIAVVSCSPAGGRPPTGHEIDCCHPGLIYELNSGSIETAVLLGKVPSENVSSKVASLKVSERRGKWIKSDVHKGHLLSTWHPSYVLKAPNEMFTFQNDIQKAMKGYIHHKCVEPPAITYAHTLEELHSVLQNIPSEARVVFDIETDQLEWWSTESTPGNAMLMMGLSLSDDTAIIIPYFMFHSKEFFTKYKNRENALFEGWDAIDDSLWGCAIQPLNDFFNRNDIEFIAHNGKYDVQWLIHLGVVNAKVTFDTMLAHYCIWEMPGTHGLKMLAADFFGMHDYESDLIGRYLKTKSDFYSKAPYVQMATYCAWDNCLTWALAVHLKEMLIAEDVYYEPFKSLIMPAQQALTLLELEGTAVDVEHLKKWQEQIMAYLDSLENVMDQLVTNSIKALNERTLSHLITVAEKTVKSVKQFLLSEKPFNPRSSYMMSFVMYDLFRFPRPNSRKIKSTSTSKPALTNILEQRPELSKHPFIDTLRKYRRGYKILRSYIKNLLDSVDLNGRIHPTFLVHGTEIGRLSARDPAVQTIPRPYEDIFGAIIRSAIYAPPGKVLIDADFSQAELRVGAVLSGDEFLKRVYLENRDLHTEVAIAMFGENFDKGQRVLCKMFNFSYLYGGNEYSFAQDSGLPIDTAKKFVSDYNATMPRLAQWKQEQLTLAKTQGYVRSPTGRKRRFPLITQDNIDDVRKACVHCQVASTASDINLNAVIELISEGYKVILTVHDSIIVEVDAADAERARVHIQEVMERSASRRYPEIPWGVDADIVSRWAAVPIQLTTSQYNEAVAKFEKLPIIVKKSKHSGIFEWLDNLFEIHDRVQLWSSVIVDNVQEFEDEDEIE